MTQTPKKFVNLHGHSTYSVGDAIGSPVEHIDFAISNGADALALTDHGHMNGFSWQYLHAKKLAAKGIPFKPVFGTEAYFVPSLKEWHELKLQVEKQKYDEKQQKELEKIRLEQEKLARKRKRVTSKQVEGEEINSAALAELNAIGDELTSAKEELDASRGLEAPVEDEDAGALVENEEESKSGRPMNPLAKRSHLVLLAKNSAGLKSLFRLVSRSFMEGQYRFPRMDFDMLKQEAKGNIIASTACVAGYDARIIYDLQPEQDYTKWDANNPVMVDEIQKQLLEMIARFKDALGPENFYLELQMNTLGCISGDAKVMTSEGLVNLAHVCGRRAWGEEVKVLSYNEIQDKFEYKQVTWGDLTHKKAKVIKLTLADGKVITLTPNHKVFTDKGWMEAQELKHPGIKILTVSVETKSPEAKFVEVFSIEEVEEGVDVFDIEVEDNHNFIANGMLVHNSQHLKNYHILKAAKASDTKLIVTCDAHYSNPAHWREREIYKAMSWMTKNKGENIGDRIPKSLDELKCELYPKNAEQIWESYKKYSAPYSFYDDQIIAEAIEQTWKITHEQIETVEPDRSVKLPAITKLVSRKNLLEMREEAGEELTEDQLAFKELKKLAIEGLQAKGKDEDRKYIDRLVHELGVVKHLKFSKYFLTYAKVMEIIGKHQLLGNARGSAGGSLLSYCLGITQMDPIKFGLLFERFLVKNKKGYPDIDSDCSDRDAAVRMIGEYFGVNNVIPVTNFAQLQVASLVKDLARLFQVPFEMVNQYTNKMRAEAMAEAKKEPGFDAGTWQFTIELAERDSPSFREFMAKMKEYPEFEKALIVLFKAIRSVSRHAGGVIITNDAMSEMPMIKSGDFLQTPWPEGQNARHLEDFGLLKFDILGLGTLRMFEDTIRKIIKKETGSKYITFEMVKNWFYEKLHPDNNNLDDPKVYEHVFWNQNFSGIFQFVQKNVQNFIAQMKPSSIIDLAVATSIFRPGPLSLSVDKQFLLNRKDPKKIKYRHPLLQEVLGDTSGLLVFQEQLQLIYHKLAGVPLDDTDGVRKAFTKRDMANVGKAQADRNALRNDFLMKCMSVNQIDPKISGEIFDEMEQLVAYSFNKAHAVAYAITSYQCAYFLTYYPDEWITSYIDYCTTTKGKQAGKEDPKAVSLSEARALGYEIANPDINHSQRTYSVIVKDDKKFLIPSFASLKYAGMAVLSEIDSFRPYRTLEDLLFNADNTWKHSKFNKRAMSTLVKLGAFESMGLVGEGKQFANYRQLHHVLVDSADALKRAVSKKNKTHKEELAKVIEEAKKLEDFTLQEKVQFSRELSGTVDLGLIVTPEIRNFLEESGVHSLDDWEDEEVIVWAIVKNSIATKTKKSGKSYMRMTLYGESFKDMPCFCWNFNPAKHQLIPENTLILGRFKKSDFGLSCFYGGVDVLVDNRKSI